MDISFISVPFLITGAVLFGLAIYSWRQQTAAGARAFSLFMFAIAIYSLGYAVELNIYQLSAAIFWNKVQYVGILTFPVFYLLFVFQYLGKADWLNPRIVLLLFSPAILLFTVKLFDASLLWIYTSTEMLEMNGRMLFVFGRGPLYPYVSVYQVFTVTVATFLVIQKRRHASELFRKQTGIMLASATVVYVVFFTYLLGIPLHPVLESIDVNPLAFGVLALGISYAIFRYGFLELVPVARDALIETLNDGVVVLDNQSRVVDANPKALEMLAWKSPPLGQTVKKAMSPVLDFSMPEEISGPTRIEVRHKTASTPIYFEISFSEIADQDQSQMGYLAVIHDISARKRTEKQLRELSLKDDLTGLYNRRGFNMLAEQMLNMVSRTGMHVCLFYCDIDGLKEINDSLGHAAGDLALQDVADIFRSSFRASDVIARIGGDEFALLGIETSEQSMRLIEARLKENTLKHRQLNREFTLDFSTGMARFDPDQPHSLENLLEEADQAMYKIKQSKISPEKSLA
jgi:diguanylate cyclase (GGDEF)-like protein/PAS domain S-box-containing protein